MKLRKRALALAATLTTVTAIHALPASADDEAPDIDTVRSLPLPIATLYQIPDTPVDVPSDDTPPESPSPTEPPAEPPAASPDKATAAVTGSATTGATGSATISAAISADISADDHVVGYTLTYQVGGLTGYASYAVNRKTGKTRFVPGILVGLNETGTQAVYRTPCKDGRGCNVTALNLTTGARTRLDVSGTGRPPGANDHNQIDGATFDGGRTVVFHSTAPNLVPGVTTTGNRLYYHDLGNGVTRLLKDPQAPDDAYVSPRAAVSPGGRYIAYRWKDTDGSTRLSVLDQVNGQYTRLAGSAPDSSPIWTPPTISNRDTMVFTTKDQLVPQDTNNLPDVYLRNLQTGTTTLVSADSTGAATGTIAGETPRITADGHYALYAGPASQMMWRDVTTGTQRALTGADNLPQKFSGAVLSRSGRFLAAGGSTENGLPGVLLRDQAQDCAGEFATTTGSGTVLGTPGDDVIYGSNGNDTIYGYGGDDVICGLGGDDFIDAGAGDDAVYGGDGDDRIEGNLGNDVIDGGLGSDSMNGGLGTDALLYRSATAGVDVNLNRSSGNGMPGENDEVLNDFEILFGSAYNDTLTGREHSETMFGMGGDDLLLGNDGNDLLFGGDGKDVLIGMKGNDLLDGGAGANSCVGGPGINILLNCAYIG
ncbi:calcium-binding protein [Sphaerisporangium sp. NPDC051017]|uniref:calcium-binding protein n=1 Tax=Sphaerisporangium sp. NPDC051017 TaxID=3154636 RepID=UPI0034251300